MLKFYRLASTTMLGLLSTISAGFCAEAPEHREQPARHGYGLEDQEREEKEGAQDDEEKAQAIQTARHLLLHTIKQERDKFDPRKDISTDNLYKKIHRIVGMLLEVVPKVWTV